MATYTRLTDYKSSDEKEQGYFKPENRYEAKQEDFEKIPGSPIAYWVSDRVKDIFEKNNKLSDVAQPRVGLQTGYNDRFLRFWFETEFSNIGFEFSNREKAKLSGLKWFPYNKGGDFRKWYGNQEYVVNWENDGKELNDFKPKSVIRNSNYYFLESISSSAISSSINTYRFYPKGAVFDVNFRSIFFEEIQNQFYFLAFLNSKAVHYLLKILSPTMALNNKDLERLPIIFPKSQEIKQKIDKLTQECINISKEEWDSKETSWNFHTNELIRIMNYEFLMLNEKEDNSKFNIQNLTLEAIYNRYCSYWREKFYKLHENEEELNRLFIDIYELQDELTPDVPLEDITILKNETKICIPTQEHGNESVDRGELVFQRDEIMKQLISYGIGVMFGRYSLNHEGLHIADTGVNLDAANLKFNIQKPIFAIDDDNIIPVLEDDCFSDDIVSSFIRFVKVTFGEENLIENIRFIEKSLGMSLRKYFVKGFYEDHIKRYKKHPIYWMISSPKRGFMSLIYMHRYKSDVFARVQTKYIYEYITKLEGAMSGYKNILNSDSAAPAEKRKAEKEIKRIDRLIDEIVKFDREKFDHFAKQSIEIDLDDGVKVNYCKFKEILYPISGLCR